jgi:hypothetical protein
MALTFGWIKIPVLDARGAPVHRRGVTEVPGLYFLGLLETVPRTIAVTAPHVVKRRQKMAITNAGTPLSLRGLAKTLVAIAPVSALRAESLLGVRSQRRIDTLFVFALLIFPMIAFVALLFLNVDPDPNTVMPSAASVGMVILPP